MKRFLLLLLALLVVHPTADARRRWVPAIASATSFAYSSAQFDGTNDWLNRGANLTGAVDSKKFMISFWCKFTGGDGDFVGMLYSSDGGVFRLKRQADQLTVDCSVGNFSTSGTLTVATGWFHCLISCDAGINRAQIYINDVSDSVIGGGALTDAAIGFSGLIDWGVGAIPTGSVKADALFSEFYFQIGESLDMSNSTNRRKFITAGGHPADMGADGSTPTGTQPLIYLHNQVPNFQTNLGSGGNFTQNGTLTDGGVDVP